MQEIQKVSNSLNSTKNNSSQLHAINKIRPRTRTRAHTSFTEKRQLYAGKEVMIKTSFSQVPRNLPDIMATPVPIINSSQITRNVKNVLRRSTKSRLGNIYNGILIF